MGWIIFAIIVIAGLALDLFTFNKRAHKVSFKEALAWSVMWISVAIAFGIGVYIELGSELGQQWFAAYIIEKSLSMDNLFVMYMIFQFFETPANLQHKCLFWGIIGAVILRGIFIILGASLVSMFHPLLYVFGVILLWTSIKIWKGGDDDSTPKENAVVKWFKRKFNILPEYYTTHGIFYHKERIHKEGKYSFLKGFTLLAVVLLMIETTDIIFAVDSIPAAFGISTNLFILYTSNIFAVLGLRALYFVLASAVEKLWLLKYGIAGVLGFIGIKMLISGFYIVPTNLSLLLVISALLVTGTLSFMFKKPQEA